jgi:hypothetical protein
MRCREFTKFDFPEPIQQFYASHEGVNHTAEYCVTFRNSVTLDAPRDHCDSADSILSGAQGP